MPPLVGHVNPAVGVAAELALRGHRVAWAGEPELIGRLAGAGARVFPCAGRRAEAAPVVRPAHIRGPEALRFLWERFLVPLAEAMAPGVTAAVERFRPDVVVCDQQALAGGLVAERLGAVWATSATTSAEFTGALSGMPKVQAWLTALLDGLRHRVGDPASTADPRFSPHLVIAFTTRELCGPVSGSHGRFLGVGPSISARPDGPDFPWEWLDPARATVLVTLGTANTDTGTRFLAECREAARKRSDRLQAVIVDPEGSAAHHNGNGNGKESENENAASVEPTPDKDILIRPAVPQLALLQRAAAVVCHAGHNTVCEALWHGVPLVVAPIRDDQPVIAGQVVDAGAGIRVRFGRVTADRLGAALDSVLDDPGPRAAAGRIGGSFRAAGGSPAAAAHLEELALEAHR
ncbi:glycosyl transferase [Wenjunlia tyrosinilytica]|uniref:Glycosyl transferase n=1 Tax=Wenjunlia tyrosinilytica TaxID=1544741 RepID=A0A917ZET6_9ACTN|nr:glycosyl transferase [Wenjunlia tyrosinilytica]